MKIRDAYRYSLLTTTLGLGISIFAMAVLQIDSPDWLFLLIPLLLGIALPSTLLSVLMQPATSQKGIKLTTAATIVFVFAVVLMGVVLIVQGRGLLPALIFLGLLISFGMFGLWLIFLATRQSVEALREPPAKDLT